MPNVRIDVDAEIDRIRLKEQGSDPANPSSGYGWLFIRDDGKIYFKNDAGNVIGPLGERYYTLTFPGDLVAATESARLWNLTGRDLTISKVHAGVKTAPTGQAAIFDIHENGTTVFTNQANRPQIAATSTTGETTTIDDPTWANGNYLDAIIDQIGSVVAGADATITIVVS